MQILTRKSILIAFAAVTVFAFSLPNAQAQPWHKMHDEEMQQLKSEVGSRLLLKSLKLTPEQLATWKTEAGKLQPIKEELEKAAEDHHNRVKASLKAANKELKKGGTIDQERMAQSMAEGMEERKQFEPLVEKVESHLKVMVDSLTEEQRDSLRRFHPKAMVMSYGLFGEEPPKTAGEVLDRIRAFPDDMWAMHKDRMLEKKGRGRKKFGQGRQDMKERLITILDNVRSMSDSEYASKRDSLAAELPERFVNRIVNGPGQQGRRGGRGNGGMGMSPGQGMGMGPCQGQGAKDCPMGPGNGPGWDGPDGDDGPEGDVGFRPGGKRHKKMIRNLLLSDEFWSVLQEQ